MTTQFIYILLYQFISLQLGYMIAQIKDKTPTTIEEIKQANRAARNKIILKRMGIKDAQDLIDKVDSLQTKADYKFKRVEK